MKQVIKLVKQATVELVVAGIILAAFWGIFMYQLSDQSKINDTVKSKSNQELLERGFPAITAKKTVKLEVKKEDIVDARTFAKAEDQEDGDLTGQIKTYLVTVEDGKEKKTLYEGSNLNTGSSVKEYSILYVVKNSRGLKDSKRLKLLLINMDGISSER
ncbi:MULTISPECIES: hypothetical protein [Anaerostipes]|uniref:Uncharacterized protein n=1 Tax=Anaerostipes rhamnosivorans TaxID=1229621 RepID=A0A4P8IDR5_9FIRM|nr:MULTISPECIES: hypothetical protein [Anaerostipes]QCP34935.1 hypothetical protein AR1Y2_1481 [Anaerostipes rhamnosivorans]CDC34713.1 uncharacterized protein BN583_03073 [Anaerostipes sp. CAG:276]